MPSGHRFKVSGKAGFSFDTYAGGRCGQACFYDGGGKEECQVLQGVLYAYRPELCPICSNGRRDHKTIMVVENTRDLAAYEKTGKYDGVYHVLHGAISPMLGIGPEDIKLKELIERLQGDVEEVIIATNSSLEGRRRRCTSVS